MAPLPTRLSAGHTRSRWKTPVWRGSRSRRGGTLASLVVLLGLTAGAAFAWSAPRTDVALPGPDATPEQVVTAYIEAVNARDFDTSNAIDARPGLDLGRFSRPARTLAVRLEETVVDGFTAHVTLTADFEGGDGTVEDGLWGYYLERGRDGRWHITDAGVV
jgi:hypothetical protein